ncbi:MAG: sigma-70 family RNA polymerase sigma factor [Acidobacteriota bacterium]
MAETPEITSLLAAWKDGDPGSLDQLLPLVEGELRRIAHSYMRRESPNHTLQTTALVHEAYIKLLNGANPEWKSRAHFFGIAANIMRRILINYARDRVAQKRGGPGVQILNVDEVAIMSDQRSEEVLALDEALTRFSELDPVKSRIVELKCFGGLTAAEIADVTGLATPTVNLYWRLAKAWLANEIKQNL